MRKLKDNDRLPCSMTAMSQGSFTSRGAAARVICARTHFHLATRKPVGCSHGTTCACCALLTLWSTIALFAIARKTTFDSQRTSATLDDCMRGVTLHDFALLTSRRVNHPAYYS